MKLDIEKAMAIDANILDTRSPKEFTHDHIPGAKNIPIFENDERHEIGKLYKANQEEAFNLGLEYYSKKLPSLVKKLRIFSKDKPLIIYCFRGGMRSKAITQVAELLNFDAYQLNGGYKKYREFVRENLYNYKPDFRFIVLWGNTGTAKTKIIQEISPSIDLEGLAQHRSSLFGGVGLKPRSQKYFESMLLSELNKYKDENFVFTEGESQKIGDCEIPNSLYSHIKKGINIRVTGAIETRVKNTVEEYFLEENIADIKKVIPKLKQRLGKKKVEEMLVMVDNKEYEKVSKILLEKYYDPLYSHTIENKKYDLTVNCDELDECKKHIIEFKEKLIEN